MGEEMRGGGRGDEWRWVRREEGGEVRGDEEIFVRRGEGRGREK